MAQPPTRCSHEGRSFHIVLTISTPGGAVIEEDRWLCVICVSSLLEGLTLGRAALRAKRQLVSHQEGGIPMHPWPVPAAGEAKRPRTKKRKGSDHE